jgi:four helix bundle protein
MKFEDLNVWEKSKELSVHIYKELRNLKDYGFRDQITRSALSIASNIAEGMERGTAKDCIKFLQYAKGSCGELRTQIYIGIEIGYISEDTGNGWIQDTREISAMLVGLIRAKDR